LLVLVFAGLWVVALAQDPPEEQAAAEDEAATSAIPCVPGEIDPQEPVDEAGPTDGEQETSGQESEPCEPPVAGDDVSDTEGAQEPQTEDGLSDASEGAEPVVDTGLDEELAEANEAAENDADSEPGDAGETDEEFTPGEEISEDYPVPLPADI
jgi:hypothetical protein